MNKTIEDNKNNETNKLTNWCNFIFDLFFTLIKISINSKK